MKKEDKSNLVDEAEEEPQETHENGFVGDKESPMKSTTVRLCGNWKLEGLTLVILVVVIFSVAVTVAMVIHILVGPPQVVPHGAATSMSAACSKVAVDIMKTKTAGAVDGAVAAALCEGVTMSHSSGLGGGALMYVYYQGGRNGTLYDCRESAPSGSTKNMFKGSNSAKATSGGLSVAVPGYLKCLYEAHKKFGKLTWSAVVQPAIKIAQKGFPMPKDLHDKLKSDSTLLNKVKSSSVLSSLYLISNKSSPVAVGTLIKPAKLAKALEKISSGGDSVFYSGELATEVFNTVHGNGGIMTKSDLSGYSAKNPSPIRGHFNHFTVLTFPLPSKGGPLILSSLNALDAYGVYRSLLSNETSIPGQVTSPDTLYYHRLVEILRTSLINTNNLGASSNASDVNNLIDNSFAKNLIKSIKANVSASLSGKALPPLDDMASGQTTLSVQGPDNVIVSFSGSLGGIFGSGIATPSGIVLNNAMGAFSLPDVTPVNENNLPGPNARPLTSLSPFIVHNPRRRCGVRFGGSASGGSLAPQASVQVVVASLLWNVPKCREKDCLDLAAAVSRPRLAVKATNKTVLAETGIPQSAIKYLLSVGDDVKEVPKSLGDVQVAGEVQHVVTAYSDPRFAGKADEY